ncbi:hypothetical protein EIK77_001483 [Talaromyces pinophilus]|nr:hypothetical protein EIK77_001483 [Talaromyces pinophilus]
MIGWSSKFGPLERGDPELHHAAGSVYAEGMFMYRNGHGLQILIQLENEPYDAERHLVLGTTDSAETLAKLEFEWYTSDEAHTAAIYASRAVFPFLLTANLRSANKALLIFTSRLSAANPSLASQQVSSTSSDVRIYPSLPLLNFLSLLLIAVQRGSADLFRDLTRHYAPHIKEVGIWDDALASIGEMYFDIKIPRQGNPLLDMMGSMFFGGGQGGGNQRGSGRQTRTVEAAPTSAELD